MKQPNIRLHIEELVLHSFAPGDRYAIVDAVQQELSRLLAAQFVNPNSKSTLSELSSHEHLDAGAFQIEQGSRPASIGHQIAQAIHGGLAK